MFNCFKWFQKQEKKKSDEYFNVVLGIGKAKVLYKNLISIAHPDKHPNEVELYVEIMNKITANRYNYRELLKIKDEIEKFHE